jgi:anti-sigma regulatory factor (Ser/Thr protein kinase)
MILNDAGWTEDEIGTFDHAVDEAITNAIIHGNLGIERGPDESKEDYEVRILEAQESALNNKNITVEITLSDHDIVVVVEDEAKKIIDPKKIPDPTSPEGLLKSSGRGISDIIKSCDDVDFSVPGKVTMRKLKRTGDEII